MSFHSKPEPLVLRTYHSLCAPLSWLEIAHKHSSGYFALPVYTNLSPTHFPPCGQDTPSSTRTSLTMASALRVLAALAASALVHKTMNMPGADIVTLSVVPAIMGELRPLLIHTSDLLIVGPTSDISAPSMLKIDTASSSQNLTDQSTSATGLESFFITTQVQCPLVTPTIAPTPSRNTSIANATGYLTEPSSSTDAAITVPQMRYPLIKFTITPTSTNTSKVTATHTSTSNSSIADSTGPFTESPPSTTTSTPISSQHDYVNPSANPMEQADLKKNVTRAPRRTYGPDLTLFLQKILLGIVGLIGILMGIKYVQVQRRRRRQRFALPPIRAFLELAYYNSAERLNQGLLYVQRCSHMMSEWRRPILLTLSPPAICYGCSLLYPHFKGYALNSFSHLDHLSNSIYKSTVSAARYVSQLWNNTAGCWSCTMYYARAFFGTIGFCWACTKQEFVDPLRPFFSATTQRGLVLVQTIGRTLSTSSSTCVAFLTTKSRFITEMPPIAIATGANFIALPSKITQQLLNAWAYTAQQLFIAWVCIAAIPSVPATWFKDVWSSLLHLEFPSCIFVGIEDSCDGAITWDSMGLLFTIVCVCFCIVALTLHLYDKFKAQQPIMWYIYCATAYTILAIVSGYTLCPFHFCWVVVSLAGMCYIYWCFFNDPSYVDAAPYDDPPDQPDDTPETAGSHLDEALDDSGPTSDDNDPTKDNSQPTPDNSGPTTDITTSPDTHRAAPAGDNITPPGAGARSSKRKQPSNKKTKTSDKPFPPTHSRTDKDKATKALKLRGDNLDHYSRERGSVPPRYYARLRTTNSKVRGGSERDDTSRPESLRKPDAEESNGSPPDEETEGTVNAGSESSGHPLSTPEPVTDTMVARSLRRLDMNGNPRPTRSLFTSELLVPYQMEDHQVKDTIAEEEELVSPPQVSPNHSQETEQHLPNAPQGITKNAVEDEVEQSSSTSEGKDDHLSSRKSKQERKFPSPTVGRRKRKRESRQRTSSSPVVQHSSLTLSVPDESLLRSTLKFPSRLGGSAALGPSRYSDGTLMSTKDINTYIDEQVRQTQQSAVGNVTTTGVTDLGLNQDEDQMEIDGTGQASVTSTPSPPGMDTTNTPASEALPTAGVTDSDLNSDADRMDVSSPSQASDRNTPSQPVIETAEAPTLKAVAVPPNTCSSPSSAPAKDGIETSSKDVFAESKNSSKHLAMAEGPSWGFTILREDTVMSDDANTTNSSAAVNASAPETVTAPSSSEEALEKIVSESQISSPCSTPPASPKLPAIDTSAAGFAPLPCPANFSPIAEVDENMPYAMSPPLTAPVPPTVPITGTTPLPMNVQITGTAPLPMNVQITGTVPAPQPDIEMTDDEDDDEIE